jgi:phage shock protein PspC (stress-responsive transcriptional regulator)
VPPLRQHGRGRNAFTRTWYRVRETKTSPASCAGLAEQFGVSVTLVRLAFLLSALFGGGMGVVIYLVLWVVMPYRPEVEPGASGSAAGGPPATPDAAARPR